MTDMDTNETTDTAELPEQEFEVSDDIDTTGIPGTEVVDEGNGEEDKEKEKPPPEPTVPEARQGGAPPWVKIPEGMKFPRGRQVLFLRFRSRWTDTPWIGEEIAGEEGKWRQCICWSISVGDKKLALQRAQADPNRLADELAKQMIRAVDGSVVRWDGVPGEGNIEQWWTHMGERVRTLISKIFLQLHTMKKEETRDFFENCIAVRSTG